MGSLANNTENATENIGTERIRETAIFMIFSYLINYI